MKNTIKLATAIATVMTASAAHSANIYSNNFDSADLSGANIGGGFVIGNRNHTSGGQWFDGVAAPNSVEKYSRLEFGDPNGGNFLSVFTDYSANSPFADWQWGQSMDASTYTYSPLGNITQDQVGETVTFSFDARQTNIDLDNSEAAAYLKVVEIPNGTYAELVNNEVDASSMSTSWGSYTTSFVVDQSMVGSELQIGFRNRAIQTSTMGDMPGISDNGMNYDNLSVDSVAAVPVPAAAWLFGSALAGLVAARRK